MEHRKNILLKLFCSTFSLSAFTFGGGYVIVMLLKDRFVNKLHWIDEEEMLDLVAIAQSSPGAIAVNGSIVVGYKLAGIPGVAVSVLGAVLPPMMILSLVSLCYDAFRTNPVVSSMLKGMTAGVGAVIASVVYDMGSKIVKERDPIQAAVMVMSFVLNYWLRVNVVLILFMVAGLGAFRTILSERKGEQRP